MRFRLLLLALFASLSCISLYSQGMMKANPDNFFVKPGSGASFHDILTNDYYGDDATIDLLEVTVLVNPSKGFVQWSTSTYKMEYMPFPGAVGVDSLVYKITSPQTRNSATSTAYFHLNDKPDVISDADCFVTPDGITWKMKELTRSDGADVHTLVTPIVGDIDNDGEIELITINSDNTGNSNFSKILIFGFNKLTNTLYRKYVINLPQVYVSYPTSIAIANVDKNDYAAIYTTLPTSTGCFLIKYKYSAGNYVEEWRQTCSTNATYRYPEVVIADFSGTEVPMINVYDKIFDARTGMLLVDGALLPATGLSPTYSMGEYGHLMDYGTGSHLHTSALVPGDIDGDGKLELIGGDCVYKVNITNTTGTSGNSFTLYKRADNAGRTDITDGAAALVDIDLDGKLEVVVTGRCPSVNVGSLYIYNPRTGVVLNENIIADIPKVGTGYGPSRPFVGDLDGDGYLEIALTGVRTLRAYKYNTTDKTIRMMWHLPTSDVSASTTLSLFDFTQSGISQLIYRDQSTLRIIDGREKDENGIVITDEQRTLETYLQTGSLTMNEYPIVVDVNGDGAAEIAVTATNGGGFSGQLRIYASDGSPWAPARSVWNQLAYNPVYVNDDLTIPANPINPATVFYSSDEDGKRIERRPFNNFLQQATTLNKEGAMTTDGADLAFSSRYPRKLKFNDDGSLTVSLVVENIGIAYFNEAVVIQIYSSLDTTNPITYTKVGDPYTDANSMGFAHNSSRPYTFTIPANKVPAEGTYNGWAVTVNLLTNPGAKIPSYLNGKECHDGYNNRALGFNLVDGMIIACEGSSATVKVSPADIYDIDWYTLAGVKVASKADSYTLPSKNSDVITKFVLRVFKKGTTNLVTSIPDTAFVYRSVDSLIWTNAAGTRDWHDSRNWRNPDLTALYEQANIPMSCTNVLLPSDITSQFPNLNATATDYSQYAVASCSNIHFGFGSGVSRPDMLTYSKAFVEANLLDHRWFMFAPPLKEFYSGDFYLDSPIPFYDRIKSYTKLWGDVDPKWNQFLESAWTKTFANADVNFALGKGLGIWISDKQDRDNITFKFNLPKPDLKYHVYFTDTDSINSFYPAKPLSRTSSHRFIFDGQGANGADFSLNATAQKTGSLVLVGNPFMSHIDFDEFYEKNKTKIKPEYRVMDKSNNNYLYYRKGQPAASTLTKNIAPMQAFLVEALTPFTTLEINAKSTSTLIGSANTIRSTAALNADIVVPIEVYQGEYSSRSFISFGENYKSSYDDQNDVMSMFSQTKIMDVRPIGVYTGSGNIKMALNTQSTSSLFDSFLRIPIGIRTPSKEPVSINIGNLSGLPSGAQITIFDAVTGKSYPLNTQSMYTFEAITPDANLYVDNRFFLDMKRSATGIDTEAEAATKNIYLSCNNSQLSLQASVLVESIDIYNLQGQVLKTALVNNNSYTTHLPYSEVYIVRTKTKEGVSSHKILNTGK